MNDKVKRDAKNRTASKQGRRDDILAAAIKSIVTDGYNRTSVSQVARLANVARPLVQYYFPTREHMLRAAIRQILDDWYDRYLKPPAKPHGSSDIGIGVERLWHHMQEPTYRAYQELQSAARMDPALRTILDELDAESVHHRHAQAAVIYTTFSSSDSTAFTDARAFTTIFLEGLRQHRFGPADETSTVERQLLMLTKLLEQYWAQHGVAPDSAAAEITPPPAVPEIRQQAEELITQLQSLIKTTG